MFNLIKKFIKPEKTISELTRDIESVMRYQIDLNNKILNLDEGIDTTISDISEIGKQFDFYENRIKQLEDNSRVMDTKYKAMAQKLHAYCMLLELHSMGCRKLF
jgi:SMC interacting uncharacterized protein involved in chromosome segregation